MADDNPSVVRRTLPALFVDPFNVNIFTDGLVVFTLLKFVETPDKTGIT